MAKAKTPTTTAAIAQDAGIVDQQAAVSEASTSDAVRPSGAAALLGQAGGKARDFATAGKDAATDRLDSFAGLVAGLADTLGDKLGPQTGDYARKAADTVTSFAEGLKGKDVDDLVEDTRKIIKQNPAMAIGAAAALGFVLVRLAKASPREDD